MTEAQNFLESTKNTYLWLHKATSLFNSAEVLFNESVAILERIKGEANTLQGHTNNIQATFDLVSTSQLLYGYALETLLKCILITTKPDLVEFDIKSNGRGDLIEAKVTQLGVAMNKGHDLPSLANAIGLIERSENPKEVKLLLTYLTECIQWRSRYPTPQHSKKYITLSSEHNQFTYHNFRALFIPIYELTNQIFDEMIAEIEV